MMALTFSMKTVNLKFWKWLKRIHWTFVKNPDYQPDWSWMCIRMIINSFFRYPLIRLRILNVRHGKTVPSMLKHLPYPTFTGVSTCLLLFWKQGKWLMINMNGYMAVTIWWLMVIFSIVEQTYFLFYGSYTNWNLRRKLLVAEWQPSWGITKKW